MIEGGGKTMLWVHDEMLRPDVLREDEPACFVFDDQWIRDARISLKRVVFMAECLEQMPGVEVRRGDVVAELMAFAETHGVSTIRTQVTPLPRLRSQIDRLSEHFTVEFAHEPPFVALPGRVDLKRFSRYWNKAKKQAFKPTAKQGSV
ncbi:MAG: hypothetical protein AAF916_04950 [Planctomycetota bacterium]